jgi:hypothetical protein
LVSFLYDQELTYTVDNPDGGALFLSRVVTTDGQERDNQMTSEVIQLPDFGFLVLPFEINRGRCGWELQQCK